MIVPETSQPRLRLLLDSNIVVAVEPYGGDLEPGLPAAAELVRLATEHGHRLCVAPANRDDIMEGSDLPRRRQRLEELKKFSQLEEVPISASLVKRAGPSEPGTNDHRDLRLLATLESGAVQYLVTEDRRLLKRSRRADLGGRVLTLAEALELLRSFLPPDQPTPPRVERIASYSINVDDPIFESLRSDYEGFDEWLVKVKADSDQRVCFVIPDDGYAGIALLKEEPDNELGLPGPVIKISTFKVSPALAQNKLGELLLKSVFLHAHHRVAATLYVTVFDKHQSLIRLFSQFGFAPITEQTPVGEAILVKSLQPNTSDEDLDDLAYQVRYGPPALLARQSGFLVPILPEWHDQLFPEKQERPDQLSLFVNTTTHPWGNALRKAYLSNSATNKVLPGDLLFFYRSHGHGTICAVGIVEDTIRSADPNEVSAFVGLRTVYTFDEISTMCGRVSGTLAVTFRQDRFLEPEIPLAELIAAGVAKAHPQQITRIPERGMQWLRERLNEQS